MRLEDKYRKYKNKRNYQGRWNTEIQKKEKTPQRHLQKNMTTEEEN